MEEITTIFVVGFPDDMNEREFQNMFIFNPGFEAATLKIPSPNKDGRKQIIGFAKFHTKMDALNAMEVLTGRQIDFEKGSILKAEMAKKNLHTKKTMMNMYYPASSIKNTCMQYHNMIPDNVNNCMNFNNNSMANNLCNQLLKDDSLYQLNNLNRGMNIASNAGMGPIANNGIMLPGVRERNGNINILNSAAQSFMDQNSSLFGNRKMYKLPNYQNLDMSHSTTTTLNNKPSFDKLYKNIQGNNNGVANNSNASTNSLYSNSIFNFLSENSGAPKVLKQQQSLPNNLFSFNNSIQKSMQQPNTFSVTPSGYNNNLYKQSSSLLDSEFSVNNNQFGSNATNHTSSNATGNGVNGKFNQNSSGITGIESPFSNDIYNNNFNLPINYFSGNSEIMKSRSSLQTSVHENNNKDTSLEDLKKVSPLSTSSTTPLFFSSPINKTSGLVDLNNSNTDNRIINNVDLSKGNSSTLIDTTDLNNKFYNLSLNMVLDKSNNESFDDNLKGDQTKSERSKEELDFLNSSSTNDFINNNSILKNNFTFNLFNNESSSNILDSLNKNDTFDLISKLSSSSVNLPYKKPHFDKMNSLNEKESDISIQSNEESSSTINSNTITNAKSNNSLNSASDFTLNENNTDNKTEPESSIFSSLSNLTSEPIIPPPQVYSSSVGANISSQTITNESN